MDCQVELIKTVVKKLNVEVDVKSTSNFIITTTQTASVYDPTDSEDPTVMVKADFKLCDDSNEKNLSVNMSTEFIFKLDPIPNDRSMAVSKYCWEIMRKQSMDIAKSVLQNMGHVFSIDSEVK